MGDILSGIFGITSGIQSNNAANQATAAQNQLIQQYLAPMYQQMLQTYQQQYAPQIPGEASQVGDALNSVSQMIQPTNSALGNTALNPSSAAGAIGANPTALTQADIANLSNPQNSVAYQTALQALPQLMNPQSSLGYQTAAGAIPQVQGLSGQLGQISNALNPISQYFSNPGATQEQMTGQQALQYFQNLAQQGGINPAAMQTAEAGNNVNTQRSLADLQNTAGPGTNVAAQAQQLLGQGNVNNATTLANLAGQQQGLQNSEMGQAYNTASGMTNTANQMIGQVPGILNQQAGLTMDQGQLAQLASSLGMSATDLQNAMLNQGTQTAGGMSALVNQMLSGAQSTGSSALQSYLANLLSSAGNNQNALNTAMNFTGQGNSLLSGGTSGFQGLQTQYGNAASQAAQNSQQDFNNAFSSLGNAAASAFTGGAAGAGVPAMGSASFGSY